MLRSDFGSALVSGAHKSGALELVGHSLSTENAYSAQVNLAICTIYSLFLEYFKV
jgi:hypothetical protein